MAPEQRRQLICDLVRQGTDDIAALARELGVAEITIRRDLALLQKQGKLIRVHGGAMPNDRVAFEFSFGEKEKHCLEEKAAIGRAAARLVESGQAVFIDTGTTTLAAARCLRAVKPNVIVTINLCVASEYVGDTGVRVFVPGGEVGRNSPDVYGEWCLELLSRIYVDVAFVGCDRVDVAEGYSCADPRIAAVSRLILDRSRSTYLLADHTKFGGQSFCHIAPLGRLAGVITDAKTSSATRKAARKAGIDLIIA